MIHWEGYGNGRSHFDLVVELRITANALIEPEPLVNAPIEPDDHFSQRS